MVFVFTGCASAPKPAFDYSRVNGGTWQAKVEIEDTKKNENHSVSIKFRALKNDKKIRADINAVMGIHIASFVVDASEYEALLMKKKSYFSGRGKDQLIGKNIFGIAVDLGIFPAILYDEPIAELGWICHTGGDQMLQDCQNEREQLGLEVKSRDGIKKLILVSGPGYKLKVSIEKFVSASRFPESAFKLPIPKGFKKL